MTNELKKCPFCAEEIKIEAKKCKYCGEFLNIDSKIQTDTETHQNTEPTPKKVSEQYQNKAGSGEKNSSTSTSQERQPAQKNVDPLDFDFAVIIAILSIVLSFTSELLNGQPKFYWWIMTGSIYTYVRLLIYFRKYLKTFEISKPINLVNWVIAMDIILSLLMIILYSISEFINPDNLEEAQSFGLIIFLSAIIVIAGISSIVVNIKLGFALQKIKNDFTGLLKPCGIALVYSIPFELFFVILGSALENEVLGVIGIIIGNIPTIYMILMFSRIRKFLVPLSEQDAIYTNNDTNPFIQKRCLKCNQLNLPDSNFCEACGTKLN